MMSNYLRRFDGASASAAPAPSSPSTSPSADPSGVEGISSDDSGLSGSLTPSLQHQHQPPSVAADPSFAAANSLAGANGLAAAAILPSPTDAAALSVTRGDIADALLLREMNGQLRHGYQHHQDVVGFEANDPLLRQLLARRLANNMVAGQFEQQNSPYHRRDLLQQPPLGGQAPRQLRPNAHPQPPPLYRHPQPSPQPGSPYRPRAVAPATAASAAASVAAPSLAQLELRERRRELERQLELERRLEFEQRLEVERLRRLRDRRAQLLRQELQEQEVYGALQPPLLAQEDTQLPSLPLTATPLTATAASSLPVAGGPGGAGGQGASSSSSSPLFLASSATPSPGAGASSAPGFDDEREAVLAAAEACVALSHQVVIPAAPAMTVPAMTMPDMTMPAVTTAAPSSAASEFTVPPPAAAVADATIVGRQERDPKGGGRVVSPGASPSPEEAGSSAGGAVFAVTEGNKTTGKRSQGETKLPLKKRKKPSSTKKEAGSNNSEEGGEKKPRKKGRKKENGMPRRPLSAYNIFFSEERERILNEIPNPEGGNGGNENSEQQPSSLAIPASVESGAGGLGQGPVPLDAAERMVLDRRRLASVPSSSSSDAATKRRRKHRRTHGKIGFRDLARTIGQRWKTLPGERMDRYRALAKVDMGRYQEELARFRRGERMFKADVAVSSSGGGGGGQQQGGQQTQRKALNVVPPH